MKKLYTMLTRKCNLNCPHCDVQNIEDTFNKEKFINTLLSFDGTIILFGGEPTFYQDRLFEIIDICKSNNKHISTISTNLMILNDRLLNFYRELKSVSTSWNPNRFTEDQYNIWINNCKKVSEIGVKPTLLITLDKDLLNLGVDSFLSVLSQWDNSIFSKIKLEYFNGDNPREYYECVDNFLCELYNKWNSNIPNDLFNNIDNWYFDCSDVYTLTPEGNIKHRCPHDVKPAIPLECYSCERVSICKPCILQKYCSFPKKLYTLMKGYN